MSAPPGLADAPDASGHFPLFAPTTLNTLPYARRRFRVWFPPPGTGELAHQVPADKSSDQELNHPTFSVGPETVIGSQTIRELPRSAGFQRSPA